MIFKQKKEKICYQKINTVSKLNEYCLLTGWNMLDRLKELFAFDGCTEPSTFAPLYIDIKIIFCSQYR